MHRLQKARGAFQRLRRIWAAREIGRGAKITKNDERKLSSFQCQSLRRMLRITWRPRMTNKRVVELAEINDISCEVGRKRWNWLGHILRREGENDCFPR